MSSSTNPGISPSANQDQGTTSGQSPFDTADALSDLTPSEVAAAMLTEAVATDDLPRLRIALATLIQREEYSMLLGALQFGVTIELEAQIAHPLSQALCVLDGKDASLAIAGHLLGVAEQLYRDGQRQRDYFHFSLDYALPLLAAMTLTAERRQGIYRDTDTLQGRSVPVAGTNAVVVLDRDGIALAERLADAGVVASTISIDLEALAGSSQEL